MHDLIVAALSAATGGVVVHVWHRVAAEDRAHPAPPLTVPAYFTGTDNLDLPPYYQRAGLPGRPKMEGRTRG